jgi:hypothetical protein
MDMSASSSRRKFLTTLGIGSAAAAAAVAVRNPAPAPQAQQVATSQARGYRVTEHVLKYYRTTRV